MFLQKYVESVFSDRERMFEDLRSSPFPLVIYGAGEVAERVLQNLKEWGISVSAMMVDAPFRTDACVQRWAAQNIPVYTVEEAFRTYPELNVGVGFSEFQVPEFDGIRHVYWFHILPDTFTPSWSFQQSHESGFEWTYNRLSDQKSRDTMLAWLRTTASGLSHYCQPYYDSCQYFTPDVRPLSSHEVLVDCGAYNGDTLNEFLGLCGEKYSAIYCLEPDAKNYETLTELVRNRSLKNVFPLMVGSSDRIDDLVSHRPVTRIKMDIEGAELDSLRGAEQIIREDRPVLAICVYHRPDDLIRIPQYIHSLVPEYQFYLRVHTCVGRELVLYAVCDEAG